MLRLLPFIAQCNFYASVYSLNTLLGYIENLKNLEIRPRDSHNTNQKTVCGISDFHNLSTTVASDVTHIRKISMSNLIRKTRKQTTVISKIPYTDLENITSPV